jgi:hypothetical protein
MAATSGDVVEAPDECWCCGSRASGAILLRLHSHPEVGVCVRCVRWLDQQKDAIERRTGQAPAGPWWRSVQHGMAQRYDEIMKRRHSSK